MRERMAMTVLCAGLSAAAASLAEDRAPADLPRASVGWIGLGRDATPQAGKASCTGVLVAPDLVVTAGHCVGGPEPVAAADVVVRLGQGPRGSLAVRHALAIHPLPVPAGSAAAQIGQSLAILRLDAPIPGTLAAPLALASAPPPADSTVAILGYPRSAPAAPEIGTDCRVQVVDDTLFGLDCPAVSGYSGGPVLIAAEGGWRLAGIMVAQARGVPGLGALALWLDPAQSADAPD